MNTLTYNTLFRGDMDLKSVPELVDTYENTSDTEWVFHLRQGVKFHDGSEMTADDVVASIEYAKTCPEVNLYNGSVEKIEKVDDYTVKITTPGHLPEHHGRRQLHSRHRQLFGQQYAVLAHRCLPQQVHRCFQQDPSEQPRSGCPDRSGVRHHQ